MNNARLRTWGGILVVLALLVGGALFFRPQGPEPVRIGSKAFTEGVLLGDVLRLLVESEGVACEHKAQMGGTRIVWNALVAGEIDAYVEYTGTLQREILATEGRRSLAGIRKRLEELGVRMGPTLGFNNTYDLAMPKERAEALGIRRISDLRAHPELKLVFSHEFMDRDDGWPPLKRRYDLPQAAQGIEHALAYSALASGEADIMEVYSTDAQIVKHGLVVLTDDLDFFPTYEALILYRTDLEARHPEVVRAFELVRDRISEERIKGLNAAVDIQDRPELSVAAAFLEEDVGLYVSAEVETPLQRIVRMTKEHVLLVVVSLLVAVLVGIALGIVAAKTRMFGQVVLGVVGAAQTFPGLALFALLVPVLGLGWLPTVVGLVVYSLLPIVRNTYAGITGIRRPLAESARVLGLSPRTRLFRIELPLAAPAILAGVKTAAVWNVGLAALGALIGAGGYGQAILEGIRKADNGLLLQGAIPAIVLALLVQVLFDLLERRIVSKGLRQASH